MRVLSKVICVSKVHLSRRCKSRVVRGPNVTRRPLALNRSRCFILKSGQGGDDSDETSSINLVREGSLVKET